MKRTPLKRGASQLRRTPLRKVGARGKAHRERMDDIRPLVFARDFWCCQARIEGVCTIHAENAHHILPSEAGGSDVLDNLISLCRPCHDWVHNTNPERARSLGLLRSRYGRRVA